jgi:hypothetical protein
MRLLYLTQTKETKLTDIIQKLVNVLAEHGELRVRLATQQPTQQPMQQPTSNTDGIVTHELVSTG